MRTSAASVTYRDRMSSSECNLVQGDRRISPSAWAAFAADAALALAPVRKQAADARELGEVHAAIMDCVEVSPFTKMDWPRLPCVISLWIYFL